MALAFPNANALNLPAVDALRAIQESKIYA